MIASACGGRPCERLDPLLALRSARDQILARGSLTPDLIDALTSIREAERYLERHARWAEAARPRGTGA